MADKDETRQTVEKEFDKPVSDKLYQPTPLTVGALADELYTVYQAEITHRITMERVEKDKFTTQGYDIMDELETKIASAIALYGQGKNAKYVYDVKHDAYPKSPSLPMVAVLLDLIRSMPADSQPTVQSVKTAFLKLRGTEQKLMDMYRGGYYKDFAIRYSERNSKFKGGPTGLDYVKRKIEADVGQTLDKGKYPKEFKKEVKERLEQEKKALQQQGVFYEFGINLDLNKTED